SIPLPLCSPLLPYTTLFRSQQVGNRISHTHVSISSSNDSVTSWPCAGPVRRRASPLHAACCGPGRTSGSSRADDRSAGSGCAARSEEHTSELQLRENLVCRL